MEFLRSIGKSVYNVTWLKEQRLFPGKAWSYYFIFTLVVAVLTVLPIAVKMPGALKSAQSAIVTKVPDFSATFKGGTLSVTNLPQPYTYTFSGNMKLVVDTVSTNTLHVQDYLKGTEASGLFITRNGAELYDATQGDGRSQTWSNVSDVTLTKASFADVITKALRWPMLVLISFGLVVGVYIVLAISRLINLFVAVVIAVLVGALLRRSWKIKELFVPGLYAITLPSLIALVVGFIAPVSSLFFLALLAFLIALVLTKPKDEAGKEMV